MGRLIRSVNWSQTPIGDPSQWPQSLCTTVSLMLCSYFPMYIAWGPQYTQLYNDGYRPILGSTKHPQAMGIGTRETFAEIWETIGPMFEGVMQGEAVGFPNFVLQLDRNGYLEECYFDFCYSPIKLPDGTVGGVLVTVVETTENVKNLRKLQASRESFKNMVLQAPVAMCVLTGPQFIIEIANERVLEMWQKTEAEVMDKPLFEAVAEAAGNGLEEMLLDVFRTGRPLVANEQPVKLLRNGKVDTTYINFTYQPLRHGDGTIYGVAGVAIEVTEQVNARKLVEDSEKNFRDLAGLMPQIVYIAQADGPLEYCNQQWYSFTGVLPGRENDDWAATIHPDDLNGVAKAWASSLQTGRIFELEYRMLEKETGAYRWFLARSTPIRNEDGEIVKWFGTSTDINEQKLLQQQKDEFISVVSHELKTPITSVKASIQLLDRLVKTDPTSPKVGQFIDKASTSIKKMQYLVDDLMDISKIEAGQLMLHKTTFVLADMLKECCDHFALMSKHEIVINGDAEIEVHADYQRIDQVLVNLVNNAIKYAPGSKNIVIAVEQQNALVKISIKDFGIGISADKLPHLFKRYYRVDSSGVQFSGLGLGLYICADIIKRHGGKIGVASTVGEGSNFWFTLPAGG
jgi:two-component system sensor histidine kinase VicK